MLNSFQMFEAKLNSSLENLLWSIKKSMKQ